MQEIKQIQSRKEFEEFFQRHHADLIRYAKKFVYRTDVASDIVQEAFVKLWENRSHIIANVSIKAYLFKVVYNLSLNHIEQLKVRSQHHESIYEELRDMEVDYYRDERSILQEERIESVRKMIRDLPSQCQEIIDLSRYQGLKNKEIAKKLDLPTRTVETRIYRCINKLRELVSGAVK
ncbi:MAG: RNA polymerase sigma-70 factor [Carboxylicivirga sp.]|jgi:RNA polymerase sigma-70 factor (ECF subfamily)|nr:RNA polymerase sigma-70 factor [Carboxylicivirga sp.]